MLRVHLELYYNIPAAAVIGISIDTNRHILESAAQNVHSTCFVCIYSLQIYILHYDVHEEHNTNQFRARLFVYLA